MTDEQIATSILEQCHDLKVTKATRIDDNHWMVRRENVDVILTHDELAFGTPPFNRVPPPLLELYTFRLRGLTSPGDRARLALTFPR